MNRFLISFIALLLACTSAFAEMTPALDIDIHNQETLEQSPLWSCESFIFHSSKKSAEITVFASQSTEMVFALTGWAISESHLYYLPIYGLVRQKEYFLLI